MMSKKISIIVTDQSDKIIQSVTVSCCHSTDLSYFCNPYSFASIFFFTRCCKRIKNQWTKPLIDFNNYPITLCTWAVSDLRLTNLIIIKLPRKGLIYNRRKLSASILMAVLMIFTKPFRRMSHLTPNFFYILK